MDEACKQVKNHDTGVSESRLGVDRATLRRWMEQKRLPRANTFKTFCKRYNNAVEDLDGYSPISDKDRDWALALLDRIRQEESPEQQLQDERVQYDSLSRVTAEVQAERDGLLAELADERRTAAEHCYAVEQRLHKLQARHRRAQRRLRQERRKRTAEAGRRQREAAVHAAAQEELAQAQRIIADLRHALTASAEAHERALADRDTKLAEYRDELTALRDRLAALNMSQADRDAAGAVVGDAITTAEQAHAQLQHREPDPDQLARRARQQEVIARLRAAGSDAQAVRRILRTVAATWSDEDIDMLVLVLCLKSPGNDWGPALARRLARQAHVRYWVPPEPFDVERLVRGPGYGTRLWCQLRGIRLVTRMSWPDTFFKPLRGARV
ncbi:hypothetical protein DF19_27610 [Streptomyces olindensis]|nr:hypothetical protein DF19_27610 [Streptomyces olindensis]